VAVFTKLFYVLGPLRSLQPILVLPLSPSLFVKEGLYHMA
jgi:hypothetical protein